MYMTRYTINHSRTALGWISNPYRVHQRLLMAYPSEPRLLYRIEENDRSQIILVQSSEKPDWKTAFEKFSVLQSEPETKSFELKLLPGAIYHFRLRANPTVTRNGKRLGLHQAEDELLWLERQIRKNGAQLLACQIAKKGLQYSSKNPIKDEHIQIHLSVLYEGMLKVTDGESLANSICKGIGPAKAYGFGLLTLASYTK